MKHILALCFVLFVVNAFALADIQVTYTGFTADQQAAFESAISLWENVLCSEVPIKINVTLQNVPGFVVVFVPNLIRNFAGTPHPNIWYCNSLANAITGVELNPGEADIDLIVNPNQPWYYGLDGLCPASSLDFVTEMRKAIAYGLGYMPSFYVQSGMGTYGHLDPSVLGLTTSFPWESMQGAPVLYDTFVCNTSGQYLTDTTQFTNVSPALNTQLTGGNLRYNGPYGVEFAGGTQPVLYASAFNLARTARLFADTYLGTENEPGIPTAYNGSVLRHISPIVLGILIDQGWTLDLSWLALPPQELEAYCVDGTVYLNWTEPDMGYDIFGYKIYRDGEYIAQTTTPDFSDVELMPGTYTYEVETIYSMGTSLPATVIVEVFPTAIQDYLTPPVAGITLSICPNPLRSSGTVSVKLNSPASVKLELFDIKGRFAGLVYSGWIGTAPQNIEISPAGMAERDLPSGIYLLRLSTESGSKTIKTMILK